MLKILSLSSEVAPFAKTGGLADVCGSLPKALAQLGHDVRVAMPAYASIESALHEGRWGIRPHHVRLEVPVRGPRIPAGVLQADLPGTYVPTFFLAERRLFGERSQIYGYQDDSYRFAFFCRAALDFFIAAEGWRPDVIHAHDWHAAPALAWLSNQCDPRYVNLPTVFTIHNLMHQGKASVDVLNYLLVRPPRLLEERPGEVNFMARGIIHATMINTVSPTYAREILSREGGFGLDGLLRHRSFDVHGILNGLDYTVWDPMKDPNLASNYDVDSLERRRENKRALQARMGLPQREDIPVVALVTRLDPQKGLDITGHVLHLLLNNYAGEAQCVVLGAGWPQWEGMIRHLAGFHHSRMSAVIGYDAQLAPLIYAGSDLFLMPSAFEPCGLGQLIAMRYGSVPVVRATGGLVDTVRSGVTGFTFNDYNADAFWHTLRAALHIYHHDRESWRSLQVNGMRANYSWETSARAYLQLYEWAIARVRGW